MLVTYHPQHHLFYDVVIVAVYFVPTIVAVLRHHQQSVAIFLLNFILGWTLIGWLGALFWSFTNPHRGG